MEINSLIGSVLKAEGLEVFRENSGRANGIYFGSFCLKDWPVMGNPNYTCKKLFFLLLLKPVRTFQMNCGNSLKEIRPAGAFLCAAPIDMPVAENTDFLFK